MNNSKKLFSDAKKVIPSGVNSPVRYFEPYPFFVKRSQGSSLWDEDGNQFVDFCNGYGALLLGHTRKEIITAVSNQMKKGTLYTTPTALEIELSKLIKGCQKAISLMKKGDKWMVYIDPTMAYGEEGRPGIPSNSILIFEIELLEVI